MSSNITITRICQHCNQPFTAKTTVTKFCGDRCAKGAYKAKKRKGKIESSNQETEKILNLTIDKVKQKEFLTVSDVALLLNSCKKTVYNLIEKGIIPSVKLSQRKTLIRRIEIDKLVELPQEIEVLPTMEKVYELADCYSLSEVKELYRISDKALHNLIQ